LVIAVPLAAQRLLVDLHHYLGHRRLGYDFGRRRLSTSHSFGCAHCHCTNTCRAHTSDKSFIWVRTLFLHTQTCRAHTVGQSLFDEFSLGRLRRQARRARCARRMYVGKNKYRDQHRADDRASTLDRGGGAQHMARTLDRGGCAEHMADILRRSDHAEDRVNTLDHGGGAKHMTDMLRQGALAAPDGIHSTNERLSAQSISFAALQDGSRHCNSTLSLSLVMKFSLGRLRRLGAPPQREFAAQTRDSVHRNLRGVTRL